VLTLHPREERRRIQEPCLLCSSESLPVTTGVIVNESATGMLVETTRLLETGRQIWILPAYHKQPRPESWTPYELIHHPLTRTGVVVRLEGGNRAGIQFLEDQERPLYRRWFRGQTTVTGFFFKNQGVLAFTGPLTIEAASLVEKIISQANGITELLLACHQIDQIQRTAFTVLLSSLQTYEKKGIALTVVTGPVSTAYFQRSPVLPGSFIFPVFATEPAGPVVDPLKNGIAHKAAAGSQGILLIARGQTTLNRLEKPLRNQEMPVWKLQGFGNALKLIAAGQARFLVVDIDVESCGTIVQLNELKNTPLDPLPPVLAIGPGYLAALVKEALYLPVRVYLSKPTTEHEYANAIQTMLSETANGPKPIKP